MPENNFSGRILESKYEITRFLGKSSVGDVYIAKIISSGKRVSIKFLRPSKLSREESIKRFFREARIAVQLQHPNIIRVLDVGLSDESNPYIVTEYLEGESLSDLLIRKGKLKPGPAMGIIEPLLQVIGVMHKKGIIHRGIRPESAFLLYQKKKSPIVKLTDFGLSKFTDANEPSFLTRVGAKLGDFSYISPEQLKDSSNVSAKTDLYSLGVIMYELTTGELPYSDLPSDKRLVAKVTQPPTPPRKRTRSIPKALDALIMKAMSLKPEDRPNSAADLLHELKKINEYDDREARLSKFSAGEAQLTIANEGLDVPVKTGVSSVGSDLDLDSKESLKRNNYTVRKIIQWITGTFQGRILAVVSALLTFLITIIAVLAVDDESTQQLDRQPKISPTSDPTPTKNDNKIKEANDIQLEVRGLPTGAKIYYDGAPIPLNPFRVDKKEVIVPLKIEAEGYSVYTTSIVPAEDQVIKVQMTKIAENLANQPEESNVVMSEEYAPSSAASAPITPPKSKPKTRPRPRPSEQQRSKKSEEKKFIKLKDNLKVSEEYN